MQLQYGTFENTKPFYKLFRKCIWDDLSQSKRLKATGLETIMLDMIKYCFSGEPFMPPKCAYTLLEQLIAPTHSICKLKVRGKYYVQV
jgi:hypothetical protein